jgi:endo-1,4-beta-D-glucanase Y
MKKMTMFILFNFFVNRHIFGQAKPFPQNMNYTQGYKASAISTTVVRDAYNRWKSTFLGSCNGMYRVTMDDTTVTLSEGMGYGMLLTAYFGEKEYFDGLLEFYKSKRTTQAYNLMAWNVTCDGILDPGSATDGDLDVVFALIVAHCQWGESYLDEAKSIIAILKAYYFLNCYGVYTMKPGGTFGGCDLTDISYYTPAYFRILAQITQDPFWDTIAEDSYAILLNSANDSTGLVPDWHSYDGVPGGNPSSGRNDYYRYDACRTPWRMALDYLWNGNETAHNWCIKITDFANSVGAANIVDGYNLNGTARGQYNNSPFVGGFAVGAMCNSQSIVNTFAQRLLYLNSAGHDNQYFNLSLRCLYMLVLTGNFWKPEITSSAIEKSKSLPTQFLLCQNYPNPFNPSTTIRYSLGKPSQVELTIYNRLGQKIKSLVNSFQNAGEHSLVWVATDNMSNPVGSGMYFYRLETENLNMKKKMVLVR